MLVVIYEGDPGDPYRQTMRVVSVRSLDDASARFPGACMVQRYETPMRQAAPDLLALRTPQPVWSF